MTEFLLIAILLIPGAVSQQPLTGVVTGQVRLNDGNPAAAVWVGAWKAPDFVNLFGGTSMTLVSSGTTDSAGRYRLENVPADPVIVGAGDPKAPSYYPGKTSRLAATPVTVAAGATATGIDFKLPPPGVRVSGRVTRPANRRVAGTERVVVMSIGGGPVDTAAIEPDGSFQFVNVYPGAYTLSALPTGMDTSSPPVAVVVAAQDVTGIEVSLVGQVYVTWTVEVDGGGLRPRVNLILTPVGGRPVQGTLFVEEGGRRYRTPAPAGEYRVTAAPLPAGYSLKSILAAGTDLRTASLKVGAEEPPPIAVTVGVSSPPPWVKISGRVIAPTGNPNPLQVTLQGGGAITPPASVGPNGSFEFPMVLPDTIAYLARVEMANSPAMPFPPESILVSGKDLTGVEIALPVMHEVNGRISVEGSGPPPALNFTFNPDPSGAGWPFTVTANIDGTFKMTLPEGERRIGLSVPGYTVRSLSYGPADLLRAPLQISGGDKAELRVMLVRRSGTAVR